MKINCRTKKGGCIQLNNRHGVWASYAVARVGKLPAMEILYAGLTLPGGRKVQLFVNRETGLVVVDVMHPDLPGGNEVLRINANKVRLPTAAECAGKGRAEECLSTE